MTLRCEKKNIYDDINTYIEIMVNCKTIVCNNFICMFNYYNINVNILVTNIITAHQ